MISNLHSAVCSMLWILNRFLIHHDYPFLVFEAVSAIDIDPKFHPLTKFRLELLSMGGLDRSDRVYAGRK